MPNNLKPYQMPLVDETEKSYWAGFFDGEGSVRIKRERSGLYVLVVTIANTDFTNKGRLKELGAYVIEVVPRQVNWKRSWHAQFQGKKAVSFLSSIIPYLKMKQDGARLAIEFQDAKQNKDVRRQEEIYQSLLTGYPQKGWGSKSIARQRKIDEQ